MWDKMVAELERDAGEATGTGMTTNEYASTLGGKEAICASEEPIGLSDE